MTIPLVARAGHDLGDARVPPYARAVLEALRFDGTGREGLGALDQEDFQMALAFCDRSQLTLTLNHVCREALPGWVRARIDRNLQDYSERYRRLTSLLVELAESLETRGIEPVVLKGFGHSPEFTPDPLLRAQGDIDLWCRPESILPARGVLLDLGYVSLGRDQGRHLPPMVRPSPWQWRGNYYAPDLPIPVELHYELWDDAMESIPAPGWQDFWDRRVRVELDGRGMSVLSTPDTLAFASLHLLMHIFHGDVRLQRAWEIARFLHLHAADESFWSQWRECHTEPMRRLEAIVFGLVSDWFASDLAPALQEEIEALPADVRLWMERYALCPIEALFQPNKDELWLQMSLVDSLRGKCSVLRRRLLPARVPERMDNAATGDELPADHQSRFHREHVAARAIHHARALAPAIASGVRWSWLRSGLTSGFVRFQLVTVVFCLGMSVFVLLYNLYLLGLGFHADVIGRVASIMSAGTLLGALPAAAVTRRIGLRNTVLLSILGCVAACLLRSISVGQAWLFAGALLNGTFFSFWAVSYSPAIAGLSNERNRQLAFSITCAIGISVGVLGGLGGGHLPGLLQSLNHALAPLAAKRLALLLAAAFAALAALPALGLRFAPPPAARTNVFPHGRFLRGFLVALVCWSVAVGSFNPFFNAFFSERMRMSVERIGFIFALSHALQVTAVLLTPLVLRRLGDINGIALMQVVAGLALAFLGAGPAAGAALAYVSYMSFQYMSEPGVFKILMNGVPEGERSGASALYFVATSIAASLSALVAGAAISRFGYPAVLITAACLALLAALLFRTLVHEDARASTSQTSS